MMGSKTLDDSVLFPVTGDLTLHQIPYSSDPGFAGRTTTLGDLLKAFSTPNKHTRVALYGLGGIGYAKALL